MHRGACAVGRRPRVCVGDETGPEQADRGYGRGGSWYVRVARDWARRAVDQKVSVNAEARVAQSCMLGRAATTGAQRATGEMRMRARTACLGAR